MNKINETLYKKYIAIKVLLKNKLSFYIYFTYTTINNYMEYNQYLIDYLLLSTYIHDQL